jgi:protein-disulfide isomerase
LQAAHPGAIRVLMKDFPLNARCNAVVPVELHSAACEAAVAVRLAAEHGTTQTMVQWLFANQETLTPDAVKAAATSVGQIPDFAARYDATVTAIATDVQDGAALQIQSTPSVFVNGRLARLNGQLMSAAEFRQALLLELR